MLWREQCAGTGRAMTLTPTGTPIAGPMPFGTVSGRCPVDDFAIYPYGDAGFVTLRHLAGDAGLTFEPGPNDAPSNRTVLLQTFDCNLQMNPPREVAIGSVAATESLNVLNARAFARAPRVHGDELWINLLDRAAHTTRFISVDPPGSFVLDGGANGLFSVFPRNTDGGVVAVYAIDQGFVLTAENFTSGHRVNMPSNTSSVAASFVPAVELHEGVFVYAVRGPGAQAQVGLSCTPQ